MTLVSGGDGGYARIAVAVSVYDDDTGNVAVCGSDTNGARKRHAVTTIHNTKLNSRGLDFIDNNRIGELNIRWYGLNHLL